MVEAWEYRPVAGEVQRPEPGLRLVLAPNPSPMTFHGTNTFIVGKGAVAVIDPGPAHDGHLAAIMAALAPGERVSLILVSHSHRDHSPLAGPLSAETGAPVLAFGDASAGRSALMSALAENGALGGGEGIDTGFRPDATLADGDILEGDGWRLRAIHTPGHLGNHLCFAAELPAGPAIFTGDHVMAWSTSLVSPPDGDMGAFMRSLDRLGHEPARRYYPAHGGPVEDPAPRLAELTRHRRARETQILEALKDGSADAAALARRVYHGTPPALLPAAERNVLAHLIDLTERKLVATPEPLRTTSLFALSNSRNFL